MDWQYFQPQFEYKDSLNFYRSAWSGHFFFAYDLVRNLKPARIVELGTDYGHSFFSMAQAVVDSKIDAEMNAVDSWEGDKHARYYDSEVYESVQKVVSKHFAELKINLHKKYFADAVNDFGDNSIDLLHIDGLHTYEAVKDDFDTWLPKMSKSGVIMLHDISQKKKDFGVYKLWEEIKAKYATMEFEHSNGLGIVFMDEQVGKKLQPLNDFWQVYYQKEWFSDRITKKDKDIEDLQATIQWQKNHMIKLNKEIDNFRDIAVDSQKQAEDANARLNAYTSEMKYFPVRAALKLKRLLKKNKS